MANLTNKEREKIINLSENFVGIHQKIIKIETSKNGQIQLREVWERV